MGVGLEFADMPWAQRLGFSEAIRHGVIRLSRIFMKCLAVIAIASAISACGGGFVSVQGGASGTVSADANANADTTVEVAPEVTSADPEEVTATTEPPDPIYEEQATMPGPGYVWVGGYWGWTGSDWGWYSGRWLTAPEGRVYVEPYYERVGTNVVFVRGYWGLRDAPRRSYGGERIRFAAAVRPADYRRGESARFERRGGSPPGTRPAGFYERATGQARPLPRATTPTYSRASSHEPEPAHAEAKTEPEKNAVAARESVGERPATLPSQTTPAAHPTIAEKASHDVRTPEVEPAGHDKTPPAHAAPAAHVAPATHATPAAHPAQAPKKKKPS